jgi:integrase/recombinase XerD
MLLSQTISGYWLDKRTSFSKRTVEGYTYHFDKLVAYLVDPEFAAITSDDIRRFLDHLHTDQGLSMRTVHDSWIALHSLWTWAAKELDTPHVLRGKVTEPKFLRREIEPFTHDDIKRMLRATQRARKWTTHTGRVVEAEKPMALRDKAIVLTLLDGGLRATELCDLKVEDYDRDRGRLRIRRGKGAKERFVFLGDRARKALWRYLASREYMRQSDPLFATMGGGHMVRHGLGKLVARLGKAAGVDNAHPHRFRHTFGIWFLRNGGNLFELQKLLGHESLRTVQIYARLAETDLEAAGRRSSPADNWRL